MIITRKMEIFVSESDTKLRKQYYQRLYDTRSIAVKIANMTVSHLFAIDNTMPYFSKEDREKFVFLGAKGKPATLQNVPYTVASFYYKEKGVDMSLVSQIVSTVTKMYKSDKKVSPKDGKFGFFDKSLRSYKETMPIPFPRQRFKNLRFVETEKEGKTYEDCFFSVLDIPFQVRFGRDRSGNRIIVRRILEQEAFTASSGKEGSPTGYKMCASSIAFQKKDGKSKIFLYLCVDIPVEHVKINPKKAIYAYLGIHHPIRCLVNAQCDNIKDKKARWLDIGTADEFVYRRVQIQQALSRCQQDCRYSRGGHGRKRKLQAIERFSAKEMNYVDSKLHLYAKELVKIAVNNGCGFIYLVNQKPREEQAKKDAEKGETLMFRNWSYYNLKSKIEYKWAKYGIELKELGIGCYLR